MKKYSNGKILAFENPESDESLKRGNPGLRSKITIATAGAGEVGRSATIHNLHVSELAFFPDAKTTMLGLLFMTYFTDWTSFTRTVNGTFMRC